MIDGSRLAAGVVLNGRYAIRRSLGQGGFGITYEVQDSASGGRLAVKEYFPDHLSARLNDGRLRARDAGAVSALEKHRKEFRSEAEALSAFEHPNIVRVLSRFDQNDTSYFVMEFVDGDNLMSVASRGPLPADAVMLVAEALVEGMKTVHDRGILHRDIKPGNIILARQAAARPTRLGVPSDIMARFGRPVLLDFGAARSIAGGGRLMTGMATPGFAAAEQFELKGHQDARTDVYGLCATLYALLSGSVPPSSDVRKHNDTLAPAQDRFSGLAPRAFLRAIDRGLSLKPEHRQKNARDLRSELFAELPSPASHGAGAGPAAGASPHPGHAPASVQRSHNASRPTPMLDATVIAPRSLRLGHNELVHVVVHEKGQAWRARSFVERTGVRAAAAGRTDGPRIAIALEMPNGRCARPLQSRAYPGEPVVAPFEVDPRPDATTAPITVRVRVDGAEIGAARAACGVTLSGNARGLLRARLAPHHKVFLCWAEPDEPEASKLAHIYRQYGVRVIERNIGQIADCDVFHLFWSQPAAMSARVETETLEALQARCEGPLALIASSASRSSFARPSGALERAGIMDILSAVEA